MLDVLTRSRCIDAFLLFRGLAAGLLLVAVPLQAASLPGDRELVHERQQRLLQTQQQRLDELQKLPGQTLDAQPRTDDALAPCIEAVYCPVRCQCAGSCPAKSFAAALSKSVFGCEPIVLD